MRTVDQSPLVQVLLQCGKRDTMIELLRALPLPWLSACGHGVDVVREPGELPRSSDMIGCLFVIWAWYRGQGEELAIETDEQEVLKTLGAFETACSTVALEQLGLIKMVNAPQWFTGEGRLTIDFLHATVDQMAIADRFGLLDFAMRLLRASTCHGGDQ